MSGKFHFTNNISLCFNASNSLLILQKRFFMAIEHHIEVDGSLLKVTASGFDENFDQALAYSQAVVEAAKINKSSRILCDERNLDYRISTFDTYELGEFASKYASYIMRIAVVCHPSSLEDGKFYETVSVNRGLRIRVMTDMDEAIAWIGE